MAIKIYLDELLKERQISSKELCAKIGITEANLSIMRSGKARSIRFSTLNSICWHLHCEVGDLLKFDGQPNEEKAQNEKSNRKSE